MRLKADVPGVKAEHRRQLLEARRIGGRNQDPYKGLDRFRMHPQLVLRQGEKDANSVIVWPAGEGFLQKPRSPEILSLRPKERCVGKDRLAVFLGGQSGVDRRLVVIHCGAIISLPDTGGGEVEVDQRIFRCRLEHLLEDFLCPGEFTLLSQVYRRLECHSQIVSIPRRGGHC